jgi:hypothetical protein
LRGEGFDKKVVKGASGISEKIRAVTITPLGYLDEMTEPRPRKILGEMTGGKHGG